MATGMSSQLAHFHTTITTTFVLAFVRLFVRMLVANVPNQLSTGCERSFAIFVFASMWLCPTVCLQRQPDQYRTVNQRTFTYSRFRTPSKHRLKRQLRPLSKGNIQYSQNYRVLCSMSRQENGLFLTYIHMVLQGRSSLERATASRMWTLMWTPEKITHCTMIDPIDTVQCVAKNI